MEMQLKQEEQEEEHKVQQELEQILQQVDSQELKQQEEQEQQEQQQQQELLDKEDQVVQQLTIRHVEPVQEAEAGLVAQEQVLQVTVTIQTQEQGAEVQALYTQA